jgi:hypothetical protein
VARFTEDGKVDLNFVVTRGISGVTAIEPMNDGTLFIASPLMRIFNSEKSLTGSVSPRLTSAAYLGNSFTLAVQTVSGQSYILQYKNSLDDPAWVPLPGVAGNDQSQTLRDNAASGSQRFYRVLVE